MNAQENYAKLKRTAILMNFVKKHDGKWGHGDWQVLCDNLTAKGYSPIDFDQVGLLLEEKREKYLAKG